MDKFQYDRMCRGRTKLIERAFAIGAPSLRLKLRENRKIATARTDGTTLEYNPEYVAAQTLGKITFDWFHETMHPLLLHPWRIEWRDLRLANQAADYAINAAARDFGFELPDGILLDARFDGLGFEEIYAILAHEQELQDAQQQPQEQPQPQAGSQGNPEDSDEPEGAQSDENDDSGQPKTDEPGDDDGGESSYSFDANGNPQPDFVPAPRPGDLSDDEDGEPGLDAEGMPTTGVPMTADDWQQLAAQMVMLGRKAGTMPGGLQAALTQSREARVSWQDELAEFMERTVPSRRSWSRPNKRMLGAYGLILPGVIKENCPNLTIVADTSGSTRGFMQQFGDEFIGLAQEVRPAHITIISCDADIQAIHEYEPDEYDEIKFDTSGGGGTSMQPAFDWINDQDELPTAIIVLTDLEIGALKDNDVPTLFVVPEHLRAEGPFGRTIKIPPAR